MAKGKENGFTLIELSIVLVIIGLIVGGVLVGQTLVTAARLRAILTEKEKYITSAETFRDKYGMLPGDFSNAVGILGIATSCGSASDNYTASCFSCYSAIPIQTCNGNDDGAVGNPIGDAAQARFYTWDNDWAMEGILFWNHLSLAHMIAGQYVPTLVPQGVYYGNPMEAIGVNVPASKAGATATWSVYNMCLPNGTDPQELFTGSCGPVLLFGAQAPTPNSNWLDFPAYPVISPQDAYNIDLKVDDGKPGTGTVMSMPNAAGGTTNDFVPNCTTSSVPSVSQYTTTLGGAQCNLMFNPKW